MWRVVFFSHKDLRISLQILFMQRGRKSVVLSDVCTSFCIKLIEPLLQFGQVLREQIQRFVMFNRCGAEQA